jgi:hypothetical protein
VLAKRNGGKDNQQYCKRTPFGDKPQDGTLPDYYAFHFFSSPKESWQKTEGLLLYYTIRQAKMKGFSDARWPRGKSVIHQIMAAGGRLDNLRLTENDSIMGLTASGNEVPRGAAFLRIRRICLLN